MQSVAKKPTKLEVKLKNKQGLRTGCCSDIVGGMYTH